MPNLDFAVLAVAATEDGETFNLLGAGIEEVRVAQLPSVALVYLAARWDWVAEDVESAATVGVACRCLEDGALLYENTFEARVGRSAGSFLPARLMVPLPLTLVQFGRHVVELTVRRQVLKDISFDVLAQEA